MVPLVCTASAEARKQLEAAPLLSTPGRPRLKHDQPSEYRDSYDADKTNSYSSSLCDCGSSALCYQ